MVTIASFPPAARTDARVLILGSMPGDASLRAAEYYAHPRNLFWPFMGELVGAAPSLPYRERLERLADARIALWDVLASCERDGSLDSAIREPRRNDLEGLFARSPDVRWVLFNGAKAESEFLKRLRGPATPRAIRLKRLPSTSPANAGQSRAAKLQAWRTALASTGAALTPR